MAKIRVDEDEYWPYPVLNDVEVKYGGKEIEVDDETLRRWKKTIADFAAATDEIWDAVAAHGYGGYTRTPTNPTTAEEVPGECDHREITHEPAGHGYSGYWYCDDCGEEVPGE